VSTVKSIEKQYETLKNHTTEYTDTHYLLGNFKENGQEVHVRTRQNQFEVFTGVDQEPDEVFEEFMKKVPEEGALYLSEDGEEFKRADLSTAPLEEIEEVKYIGKTYGFEWAPNENPGIEGDYKLSVFSNDNFDYIADSTRAVIEVFPELKNIEETGQMLHEAIDLAQLDLERYTDVF